MAEKAVWVEKLTDWTQPVCRTCFAAWSLGRGESPHREPTRALDVQEPCMVCGSDNDGIFIRVDPKLTAGLQFARERQP